jgi:hypothetical protein
LAIEGTNAISFLRLALGPTRFLFTLLQLLRFLTIALGDRCLAWSSDGALLGMRPSR